MEFSFFLILLSVYLLGVYFTGYFLFKLANRRNWILFVLAGASIALMFFLPWIGAVLILLFALEWLAKNVAFFQKGRAIKFGLIFLVVSFMLLAYYYGYGKSDKVWNELYFTLSSLGWMKGRYIDLFFVIRFFGYYYPIYPVLTAGVLHLAFRYALREKKYHNSFWYRFMRVFDHRQAAFTIGAFLLLGLVYFLQSDYGITAIKDRFTPEAWVLIKDITLNMAVFFATPYIFYGFVTITYGLRRLRISYLVSFLLLYSFVIISGPIFIFAFIMLIGVGISDIWMNYHKRTIKILK